jgi:putative endonuclease
MLQTQSTINHRAAEARGRHAEAQVADHFVSAGFRVLARRLRTGAGELDLVVADSCTLIFVEVKARGSFTAAAQSISGRAQARLLEAASTALAQNPDWSRPDTRLDVALVTPAGIRTIRDAIRYN